ncbi:MULTISPECIES: SDR family oxidoreductase [unclassified Burkholderia]|uniref:SDR family oxidoreductase n=1 Tax=unclassified Burkholderia TaxID=2613784 RepID=UPI00141F9462|nr:MULTISPECIES: SDR family oxidoreductase [unclassified Burkholderia]NIE84526.1 SDR family oxidoreductase [Burkholderia sp. Tr-860]NIF63118.1 SDR family oxidoreductase [Burkholderia sp. Cy-647]NIF71571.1 SDR family oxidoreductase [Burkholderia sp. Ap-962]NIF87172.1 SDR family oxidoreductase [Burkholderia sp. Cy-637]NIF97477.1 SDR family oxidoreductase [Burkholderia sp. Ax-1720]
MSASKTWFITGTSTGFGRILTEKLLERGDRVAATLREPARLDALRERHGERLWVQALDVTDANRIGPVVDAAFEAFGRIDVLVNNAGYAAFGAADELSDAQIRRQLDTNVLGSIRVTRAALPHLRAQGGGRILQVSSMGGQIALPGLCAYHASKWAIEGFFEAVVQDVASFGIEVTLVEPAGAHTNFIHGLDNATPLEVYEDTIVGTRRRALGSPSTYRLPLSPEKAVDAMIASVEQSPAPRRLVLGGGAYRLIHEALTARLAELEAQKEIAFAADDAQ